MKKWLHEKEVFIIAILNAVALILLIDLLWNLPQRSIDHTIIFIALLYDSAIWLKVLTDDKGGFD